jgi:hypothetical protein
MISIWGSVVFWYYFALLYGEVVVYNLNVRRGRIRTHMPRREEIIILCRLEHRGIIMYYQTDIIIIMISACRQTRPIIMIDAMPI